MNDFPRSVAIVANSDTNIFRFRAPIVRKLREMNATVYAIAPPGPSVADIEQMGAVFVPWELDRRSLNPLSVAGRVTALARIYRRLKPDLVHHFTIMPNLYGAVAARLAGVPAVFSGVTGLGYAFSQGGPRHRVLGSCTRLLYRWAIVLNDGITFQTSHDCDALLGTGSLRRMGRVIAGGSGIDLATFKPELVSGQDRERVKVELGILPRSPVVSMASRLLYDKGVAEYVAAARLVRRRLPDACFILAGEPDQGNPGSVTDDDLKAWSGEGSVKYIGYRDDIPAIFAASDVVAHPTYYPEGIPRVLIEAAAMGKPVVSTAVPGVAEIVEDGVNGVVVPPRDANALAAAIEGLLADDAVRCRYGAAGRRKAETKYDDRVVAERYVAEYRRVWAYAGARREHRKIAKSPSPPVILSGTENLAPSVETLPSAQGDKLEQGDKSGPSVSVIIPGRNAEATIAATLDSVLSQEYEKPIEVIVADGSDSPAMARIIRASYPDVRIIPNPELNTPAGLNCAIRETTGEVIVRCDAHTKLSPGYIRRTVDVLERTGAANVGGRQQAVGTTVFERATALAMNSLIGSGGTSYRVGNTPGPTDTVYLGAWRRGTLEAIGGYDNRLIRNQDYELNWRLRQRGETIWFDPDLVTEYRPRRNLGALARQYFGYGRWKSTMLRMHPQSLLPRQLAAPLLALGLVASAVLSSIGLIWAAALPLLYLTALVLVAVAIGLRHRDPAAVLLPIVLATMHLSWGIGFFIPPRFSREVRRDLPPPEN